MLSAICFNLDQSKILSSGNGLNTSPKQSCVAYPEKQACRKGENSSNHFPLFSQCFRPC